MRQEKFEDTELYLGDCLEILPGLPVVDSVVTDPPFGTQDLGGGYGRRQLSPNFEQDGQGRTIANDRDLSAIGNALPLLKEKLPCGWMMVFYGARKSMELLELSKNLTWFGDVIWDKLTPGLGFHIRYSHESIAVYRQGEPPRPKDALLSVIKAFPPSNLHPHEKPVNLMMPLVKWACPSGGTLLDPFMGAGSTGVAAIRQNRKFIGIELEEKYFDVACRRIEAEISERNAGADMLEGLGLLA